MSLINDALRKARQAASERDATQSELPFRGKRTHPSRRGRQSTGPVFVVLIAVGAGVVGAAVAWWTLGRQQTPLETNQPAPLSAATSVEAEKPIPRPPIQPTPSAQGEPAITLQPTAKAGAGNRPSSESRLPLPSPDNDTEVDPENPAEALSPHAAETAKAGAARQQADVTAEAPRAAAGDRNFILDANLGYASLSLDYIVFRPTDPFAEINGVEVHQGSEIEGFTVEKIERDHVQLRDSRGPLVLRVP